MARPLKLGWGNRSAFRGKSKSKELKPAAPLQSSSRERHGLARGRGGRVRGRCVSKMLSSMENDASVDTIAKIQVLIPKRGRRRPFERHAAGSTTV
jgi:hypothetical protein